MYNEFYLCKFKNVMELYCNQSEYIEQNYFLIEFDVFAWQLLFNALTYVPTPTNI